MTDSKRVWIVNQYAGSSHHGMEYRHFYLAKALVAQGWDVTIVSGSFSHLFTHPPSVDELFTFELIDGVRYCWLKLPRYDGVGMARAVNMGIYALELLLPGMRRLPRPDTIIVSSPSPLPILPGALWARLHRANLVFEVRDIWPLTLVELGWQSKVNPLVAVMGWLERFAYSRADRVTAVLPNALAYMGRFGVTEERFSYIPNGVAIADFDAAPPLSPETREQLPDGKFTVGYVGTLGPANAVESLVRAAARVRDDSSIDFVIVGTGRSKESLKALAGELRLDSIRFLEPVPRREVPGLLAACDALYIGLQDSPLYDFGISPNKLFDYMCSARPVIHGVGTGHDLVTQAGCGISVAAEDDVAIADAVARLRAMPASERERLGANGRRFVVEHHSYDALARRYGDLMTDLARGTADAAPRS